MEYIVGKTAGFCYGVKNAVEKSEEALEKEHPICCLGEIVHNKRVVEDLEKKGIIFIENLNQNINKRKTIIRAHGITKDVYESANKNGINLLDLTCPKVLKIHKIVSEYSENEYYIFLIGSKKHPEIIGTASFANNNVSIIEDFYDIDISIDNFKKSNRQKLAIVVQTTFSLQKFAEITEKIKEKMGNLHVDIEIINTICNATKIRQEETEEMSKNVDYMIIIGGKNSSNTKKLYEISKRNCINTVCIESANEINKENLKQGNIVGIMAGASTPQCSINEVIELVKNT
ncbi:sSU ribosomal protein S1p [Clostridium sp. CAG:492]|nr:sSU ribosomal protein S1p [Clostridium sp. CAG:492]